MQGNQQPSFSLKAKATSLLIVPNPQPAAIPHRQSPLSNFLFFPTATSKSCDMFLSNFSSHVLRSFSTSICSRATYHPSHLPSTKSKPRLSLSDGALRKRQNSSNPRLSYSFFFSPSSKHSLPATNPFSPKSVSSYELQILSHSPPPAISHLLHSPIEGRKQQSAAVLPNPSANPSISSEHL
jgi:hypothetical protein